MWCVLIGRPSVNGESLGTGVGSDRVGPRADEGDKHGKAVHYLAKRRNVFSAVSQDSRDGETERGRIVLAFTHL